MAHSGRLLSLIMALAILSPAPLAWARDDGDALDAPTLRIPGLPPIPMPPGTHVYGPDDGPPGARVPPVANPQIATPDADLYHEYGTVTPGGGGGRAARAPPTGRGGGPPRGRRSARR